MYYFSSMKNVLGKQENLKLHNDKGNLVYSFYKYHGDYCSERTYDDYGNLLTFKNSNGEWSEFTYDNKGNTLTYKDSDGVSRTYNIPEYTMEQLTEMIGNFKLKK